MIKKLVGTAVAAAAVITAAAAISPATATAAPITIHTGDKVWIPHAGRDDSGCTVGFVFKGPDDRIHALIAGHCGDLGEEIQTEDRRTIGTITHRNYVTGISENDTALVAFAPGVRVDSTIPEVGPVAGTLARADIERTSPILCKLGAKTSLTCGPSLARSAEHPTLVSFMGGSRDGDSGAAVWAYGSNGEALAVGTLIAGQEGTNITYVDPIEDDLTAWDLSMPGPVHQRSLSGAP